MAMITQVKMTVTILDAKDLPKAINDMLAYTGPSGIQTEIVTRPDPFDITPVRGLLKRRTVRSVILNALYDSDVSLTKVELKKAVEGAGYKWDSASTTISKLRTKEKLVGQDGWGNPYYLTKKGLNKKNW